MHPHILFMATWTKTFTREPPKTKAELREMLTEAVRNTQPERKRPPKQRSRLGRPDPSVPKAGPFLLPLCHPLHQNKRARKNPRRVYRKRKLGPRDGEARRGSGAN